MFEKLNRRQLYSLDLRLSRAYYKSLLHYKYQGRNPETGMPVRHEVTRELGAILREVLFERARREGWAKILDGTLVFYRD